MHLTEPARRDGGEAVGFGTLRGVAQERARPSKCIIKQECGIGKGFSSVKPTLERGSGEGVGAALRGGQVEAMVSVGLHGIVGLAPEAAGVVGELQDQFVGRSAASGRAAAVRRW